MKFCGKKSIQMYVGQVRTVDEDAAEVAFLGKHDKEGLVFSFPSREDISWIDLDQIVETLEQPTISKRDHYCFCKPVAATRYHQIQSQRAVNRQHALTSHRRSRWPDMLLNASTSTRIPYLLKIPTF